MVMTGAQNLTVWSLSSVELLDILAITRILCETRRRKEILLFSLSSREPFFARIKGRKKHQTFLVVQVVL